MSGLREEWLLCEVGSKKADKHVDFDFLDHFLSREIFVF